MSDQISKTTASAQIKKPNSRRVSDPKRRKSGTKKTQLVRLLHGKSGADVAAISAKLGWQAHSTRAALSGLRKAGYVITAEKGEGGKPTRYRIAAEPAAQVAE